MTSGQRWTSFLLRRAEEEAIAAIRAEERLAEDGHYALSLLYSKRARRALSGGSSAPLPLRERIAKLGREAA